MIKIYAKLLNNITYLTTCIRLQNLKIKMIDSMPQFNHSKQNHYRAEFSLNNATDRDESDWFVAEVADDTCECGRLMGGNGG